MLDSAVHGSSHLGKYRLIGELGHGGMAHVYLAVVSGPARFNKLVVVKEIRADLSREPEFVMMFLDEARLAARLNHPNVVQTNEVGQDEYRFYMVMEYLEGQTLRSVLRQLGRGPQAPLTLGMKVRILCDALAGLHYAHELTDFDGTPLCVVHRDVSPHNIFVTYSGQVKVLDFGVAKAMDSVSHTSTGVLKGKVAYMAPEHARGEEVDRRADVYAAGIVLWELLTGQGLFRDQAQVAILHKVGQGLVPRPSEVVPNVDRDLEAIVLRAMAFEREQRYPTAAALARDLEGWLRARQDHSSIRQVGELVAHAFAKERARMAALVEAQIQRVRDERLGEVKPVPMFDPNASLTSLPAPRAEPPDPPTVVQQPSVAPPGNTNLSTVLSQTSTTPPAPTRSRWPLVLGATLLVGLGGVAALIQDRRGETDDAPQAASGTPATLTLRIESTPTGAEVSCAGQVVGTTPLDVPVAAGHAPCAFVVSLAGHEPFRVERGPLSGDVVVMASLRPLPSSEPSSQPSSQPSNEPGGVPSEPRAPTATPVGQPPAPPVPPQAPKDDIRLQR